MDSLLSTNLGCTMSIVQLKIVCFLGHDDIKPLFQVCKELGNTVRCVVVFVYSEVGVVLMVTFMVFLDAARKCS